MRVMDGITIVACFGRLGKELVAPSLGHMASHYVSLHCYD